MRAKIPNHRCDVFRHTEAADRLTIYQLLTNLLLLVCVVFLQVAFDERCLHGPGRDAVAPDLLGLVDGDLPGECNDGAFAGAVGESLFDPN